MKKSSKILLTLLLLPCVLLVPALVYLDTPANASCVAVKIETEEHGSRSRKIAEFRAVKEWSRKAAELGDHMSDWHNASGQKYTCQTEKRTGVVFCRAYGTPCKRQVARS